MNAHLLNSAALMLLLTTPAIAAPPMPPQMMPTMAPGHMPPPPIAQTDMLQHRILNEVKKGNLSLDDAKLMLDKQNELRKAILDARSDDHLSTKERVELIERIDETQAELSKMLKKHRECSCT